MSQNSEKSGTKFTAKFYVFVLGFFAVPILSLLLVSVLSVETETQIFKTWEKGIEFHISDADAVEVTFMSSEMISIESNGDVTYSEKVQKGIYKLEMTLVAGQYYFNGHNASAYFSSETPFTLTQMLEWYERGVFAALTWAVYVLGFLLSLIISSGRQKS